MPGIGGMNAGMAVRIVPGTALGPSFDELVGAGVRALFDGVTPAVSVYIQAHPDNAEDIYIGPAQIGDGVGGARLSADDSIVIDINDAALIYISGPTATDRVIGFIVR